MYLPTLVCLALVLAYPVLYAGYLSLHRVGLGQLRRGEFPFVGWENYARLFDDRLFWLALKNTFLFTGVTVVADRAGCRHCAADQPDGHLDLAGHSPADPVALRNAADRQRSHLVVHLQFPVRFLEPHAFLLGLIDAPINWSGNPDGALYAVTVPYIWRTLPFAILLVHAALQGIPRELYEAAAVDGATAWRRFSHITLPLLRPIIAIILILRTSFAFAVFEEILAITQGGPGDATWVAAWYSYKTSFAPPNNFGVGSASAYVLALLIGLLAIVYVRFVYRRVTL